MVDIVHDTIPHYYGFGVKWDYSFGGCFYNVVVSFCECFGFYILDSGLVAFVFVIGDVFTGYFVDKVGGKCYFGQGC